MGVRNCRELGENLQKIVHRLMSNDRLVNLLYYTDKDPLNQPYLTWEQKQELVFEKLIKMIPRVGPKEDAKSIIVIKVCNAHTDPTNTEFKNSTSKIKQT